jgi:hypothetical protein
MRTPGQRHLSAFFTPAASEDALRAVLNAQSYKEALIGILTRLRVPLSAVGW